MARTASPRESSLNSCFTDINQNILWTFFEEQYSTLSTKMWNTRPYLRHAVFALRTTLTSRDQTTDYFKAVLFTFWWQNIEPEYLLLGKTPSQAQPVCGAVVTRWRSSKSTVLQNGVHAVDLHCIQSCGYRFGPLVIPRSYYRPWLYQLHCNHCIVTMADLILSAGSLVLSHSVLLPVLCVQLHAKLNWLSTLLYFTLLSNWLSRV